MSLSSSGNRHGCSRTLVLHSLTSAEMALAMAVRRAGRLYHLKVGAAHCRRRVLAIADERDVTVVALDTGEVLSTHLIEPARGYWRNQLRDPGRWPGSRATG